MNLNQMNQMEEDWEKELDNIDWKAMLSDIDRALMDNLAAEIGFPTYEKLEQASERVVDDFYITHVSDGRWVWWNPRRYAHEDPIYLENQQQVIAFIADFLQLEPGSLDQLQDGLNQVTQMKRCLSCEHEFNPADPARFDWDAESEQVEFCSAECAMEFVMGEMKEEYTTSME